MKWLANFPILFSKRPSNSCLVLKAHNIFVGTLQSLRCNTTCHIVQGNQTCLSRVVAYLVYKCLSKAPARFSGMILSLALLDRNCAISLQWPISLVSLFITLKQWQHHNAASLCDLLEQPCFSNQSRCDKNTAGSDLAWCVTHVTSSDL